MEMPQRYLAPHHYAASPSKTDTDSFFQTPQRRAYGILPASCLSFIIVIVAVAIAKTTDDIKLMSDRQF